MVIKNLTNKQQGFSVKEITGENRVFDIFLAPYSSTEMERMLLVNPEKYAGILSVNGLPVTIEEKVETPTVKATNTENPESQQGAEVSNTEVETPNDSTQDVGEGEDNTPGDESGENESDSFICEICGAEFASARGLTAHKNKSHPNE